MQQSTIAAAEAKSDRRREQHKSRMAERRARQLARTDGFTPVPGKRSDAMILRFKVLHPNQPLPLPIGRVKADKQRLKPAASINRRTGKPHENKREIARRLARSAVA